MLEPIITGITAAIFVLLPTYLEQRVSVFTWYMPVFIFGIGMWDAFYSQFLTRKSLGGDSDDQRYDGLADFFIYIHSPMSSVPFLRWLGRTMNSFLLALCGGSVGPEGAAIEALHTIRIGLKIHSSRWFEQRRRTEVSMGLAGGISAAFCAPFAGVLLSVELGMGGRSLFAIMSSLAAFITMRIANSALSINLFNVQEVIADFPIGSWKHWLEIVNIGLVTALVGLFIVRFFEFIRNGFLKIFSSYVAIGSLVAAGILVVTYMIYPSGHHSAWVVLEEVLKSRHSLNEVGFIFFLKLLSLSIILAGFGTMGVFWPIIMLGGMVGFGLHEQVFAQYLFGSLEAGARGVGMGAADSLHLGASAGLVGSSALFGVIFGAPITGAILISEMTQNFQFLLPCLVAGGVAKLFSKALKVPNLLTLLLESRGLALLEGRSAGILDNIKIEQAMVTDFHTVLEHEPLSVLRGKILDSRYPFLPVVNSKSEFVGLLTIDMIQESWQKQTSPGSLSLSSLLEAKDLLYRARKAVAPTLRRSDPLSMTRGLFDEVPCVTILSDDGRIVGLLFVHNVRMVYDREAIFRRY